LFQAAARGERLVFSQIHGLFQAETRGERLVFSQIHGLFQAAARGERLVFSLIHGLVFNGCLSGSLVLNDLVRGGTYYVEWEEESSAKVRVFLTVIMSIAV